MKRDCTRYAHWAIALAVLGAVWFSACSDNPADPCNATSCPPPPQVLIVSNPLPAAALGTDIRTAVALTPGAADDVAYLSLAPGTVPTGNRATVRRVGDASTLTTAVSEGGFDPVPVPAQVGDSIDVVVTDDSGAVVLHQRVLVAAARPPVIVRTEPPPKKRDVPLNAAMVIVFSEPINAATLNPSSVQVLRGTTPVAGTVSLLQGSATVAVFVPAAPLEPTTDYHLVVTSAVRDLQGDSLTASATVEFTTGVAALGPAAMITVYPEPSFILLAGEQIGLMAVAKDTSGSEIVGRSFTWRSDNPAVATVSESGLMKALAPGDVIITAEMDGVSGGQTYTIYRMVITVNRSAILSTGSSGSSYGLVIGGEDTVDLAAWLGSDPLDAGVNWTLAGPGCSGPACGTLSATHSASGEAVRYTAPAMVPNPDTVTVTATIVSDPTQSASGTFVFFSTVQVSVDPAVAAVNLNSRQQFTASVSGDPNNTGVVWSVSGSGCSGHACGSISSDGIYTAPAAVPNPATVTVAARSVTDYNQPGFARLVITTPGVVTVVVDPPAFTVCAPPSFWCRPPYRAVTAFVFNDPGNAGVTWSVPVGSVSPTSSRSGEPVIYYAPGAGQCLTTILRATSVADTTRSDSAAVTIRHRSC